MSLPADWDPAYAEAYALAERFVGWLMGWGKRTKPECNRKKSGCKNMSAQDGGRIATRALDERESQTSTEVSRETKRTKPEYQRKQGAYKNISKTLGWLGAAASFLLKRGAHRSPTLAATDRTLE